MNTPEELGLKKCAGIDTYLDDHETVWIGSKWDIAEDSSGRFAVYRKGNWRITVGTLDLACAIVADNEGFGALWTRGPNGDIAHCPTCQRGCICMTAADLGFSGWGDGVNPNLIAATHPECPEHGFRAVPCTYDGCPYPTNPQYNHNHPQDYWNDADQ